MTLPEGWISNSQQALIYLLAPSTIRCTIPPMRTFSIQSGSTGNCIFVETQGVRLLFDAGVSGKTAEMRLAACGIDIRSVHGIVISHDHSDHTRCMGIFNRKYGIPVHITRPSLDAALAKNPIGPIANVRLFRSGDTMQVGSVRIETIPTPHDAVDGVAFVVDDGTSRLGIMTDLGYPFSELATAVGTLDAVYLESNYDPEMLTKGSYPWYLKNRIRGGGGHISNAEAAELLVRAASPRLRWACLAHLSEENNSAQVALRTHHEIVGRRFPLGLASRHDASAVFEV